SVLLVRGHRGGRPRGALPGRRVYRPGHAQPAVDLYEHWRDPDHAPGARGEPGLHCAADPRADQAALWLVRRGDWHHRAPAPARGKRAGRDARRQRRGRRRRSGRRRGRGRGPGGRDPAGHGAGRAADAGRRAHAGARRPAARGAAGPGLGAARTRRPVCPVRNAARPGRPLRRRRDHDHVGKLGDVGAGGVGVADSERRGDQREPGDLQQRRAAAPPADGQGGGARQGGAGRQAAPAVPRDKAQVAVDPARAVWRLAARDPGAPGHGRGRVALACGDPARAGQARGAAAAARAAVAAAVGGAAAGRDAARVAGGDGGRQPRPPGQRAGHGAAARQRRLGLGPQLAGAGERQHGDAEPAAAAAAAAVGRKGHPRAVAAVVCRPQAAGGQGDAHPGGRAVGGAHAQ
ncbi:hypothetical protein IWQ57_006313, partial [Coemansia nantahalensis]